MFTMLSMYSFLLFLFPRQPSRFQVGPENEYSDIESKFTTDPNLATDRIELRCEHTGLADSLASTRYIRYSVAGYERHIDLDMAYSKRVGTPGTNGTYEQIQFVTPPLEWAQQPSASVPVTLVLTTASGEILETNVLKHTYGAPDIKTNPTVAAGIPTLKGTFNVTLSGANFGAKGEVLRFDGWCNATLNQRCGDGAIRVCVGGTSGALVGTLQGPAGNAGGAQLCGWNIVPGIDQPFNPLIGGVFSYTNTDVEMTFKGLKGTVVIRRGT
jgi:hypothetical protein